MPSFDTKSVENLSTCDLRLQIVCNEVIKYIQFKVLEGHRGQVAQHAAFLSGASQKDWPNGKHNKFPSLAVDIAPLYFDKGSRIDWKDIPAFARLAGFHEAIAYTKGIQLRLGMDWDGDWRTAGHDPGENFLDAPHLEVQLIT